MRNSLKGCFRSDQTAPCLPLFKLPLVLVLQFIVFLATVLLSLSLAQAGERRHGLSTFGDLKYPPTFTHFDYANPDAPKGGRLALIGTESRITFDSFNYYIRKGDPAQGLKYIFDSLMVRAYDEPDALYGLVAKEAEVHDDKLGVTFFLRPEAKFSDGTALRAADVVFSIKTLQEKSSPLYRMSLRDIASIEALDPLTVRVRFQGNQTRDLPQRVAEMPIFSARFYETHPFDKGSLVPPVGSGPYKIGAFKAGKFVTYQRRDDYWAKDLPVNKGHYNFDELRYEYFKDRSAEFEALKAGVFDLREEFTSKDWATKYTFDAIKQKKVIAETLPDKRPGGTQGFFINTRKARFQDVRVREAIGLTFDFEWTNKNLFYGLYDRTSSYFENSPMKAQGRPSEAELALLRPFKDKLPPAVFEEIKLAPISNGLGQDRRLLRLAGRLMTQAGWKLKQGRRVNDKGEEFKLEFLTFSPSFSRVILPMIRNLKTIGINATLRNVDPAQYQERLKSFDFDLTTTRFIMRLTPGVELWNMFGSKSAAMQASYNLAGIQDPVVDALIEKVIQSKSRAEQITACRALDRVLRANFYWVPHWYKAKHTIAYWNKFSRPEIKPAYERGVIELWWYDHEKAAKF